MMPLMRGAWSQVNIYIYIARERERERERTWTQVGIGENGSPEKPKDEKHVGVDSLSSGMDLSILYLRELKIKRLVARPP
jgi:hypothetical protein